MAETILIHASVRYPALMTEQADFARLVRRLREEAGLSQHALARAAGIDPTNLNRIERGRQGLPRHATVLRIIRGLGLSLSDDRARQLLGSLGGTDRAGASQVSRLGERGEDRVGDLPGVEAAIRELRATLLRALELTAILDDLIQSADRADRDG